MSSEASATPTPARDRKPSLIMRVAMASFGLGLAFVLVVFLLFALGNTNLPVWLSLGAIGFTSAGFGLGLVALVREARTR